jgi:hypothetical protein
MFSPALGINPQLGETYTLFLNDVDIDNNDLESWKNIWGSGDEINILGTEPQDDITINPNIIWCLG